MEIVRLKKEDCNNAADFLNEVFTLQNGREMDIKGGNPRIFKEDNKTMGYHLAAKENGKICGIAGAYPFVYSLPEADLKIAAIENVAVDISCRGKGIMQKLLNQLSNEKTVTESDMCHLMGDRRRYRNFGFERCGAVYCFDFTRSMLGKEPPERHFDYIDLSQHKELLKEVYEIYSSQKAYIVKDFDEFYLSLTSKGNIPYAIADVNKNAVGMCCADSSGLEFSELAFSDNEIFVDALKCYIDKFKKKKLAINLPAYHELFELAFSHAERYLVMQPGCFKINNFKKVTEAFMKLKCKYEYMPDGEITIASEPFGKWSIEKRGSAVNVSEYKGIAQYEFPGFSVYSFLFGTIPPIAKGAGDELAKAWFPLPLYCPNFS